jgi:hypothetical protein
MKKENSIMFKSVSSVSLFMKISAKGRRLLANIICAFVPIKQSRDKLSRYIVYFSIKRLLVKKIKYDCIFSIGAACFVANALKFLNLRALSGPFDWIFGSTFEKRFDIFLNKFENYFEKDDFEYSRMDDNGKKDIYTNKLTGLSYNHDFDLNCDFETEYPAIRNKYDRRTSRVLDKIKNGNRTLIVYAEGRGSTTTPIEKIKELVNLANKIYGNKIDLLYLKNNSNCRPWKSKKIMKNPHVTIIEYLGPQKLNETERYEEYFIKKRIYDALSFAKI